MFETSQKCLVMGNLGMFLGAKKSALRKKVILYYYHTEKNFFIALILWVNEEGPKIVCFMSWVLFYTGRLFFA